MKNERTKLGSMIALLFGSTALTQSPDLTSDHRGRPAGSHRARGYGTTLPNQRQKRKRARQMRSRRDRR
jgi:hypothetical protein